MSHVSVGFSNKELWIFMTGLMNKLVFHSAKYWNGAKQLQRKCVNTMVQSSFSSVRIIHSKKDSFHNPSKGQRILKIAFAVAIPEPMHPGFTVLSVSYKGIISYQTFHVNGLPFSSLHDTYLHQAQVNLQYISQLKWQTEKCYEILRDKQNHWKETRSALQRENWICTSDTLVCSSMETKIL